MLNVLPRLTGDRDDQARGETRARISSFAERVKSTVKPREAATVATNEIGAQTDFSETEAFVEGGEDARLILPMTIVSPAVNFTALQEWEGYVTAIWPDTFEAELVDLTGQKRHETERATFLISDLEDEDRTELREGALFRWVVGYQRLRGTKQRVSQVYFRRTPAWSANEAARIERRAEELANLLGLG